MLNKTSLLSQIRTRLAPLTKVRNQLIFGFAALGVLLAVISAFISMQQPPAQQPVFKPAANPYAAGIYANGIIESDQKNGENVNIYPEVTGPITTIAVAEGQTVHAGDTLITIDDSVQRATTEQLRSQADAALTLLKELKAEPRPENLAVAAAQVDSAEATLKSATDEAAKQERSYAMDPKSVSLDVLDNARNAMKIAAANLKVARQQYALTKAGAWVYDIQNQEKQYIALSNAYQAASSLLAKYALRAPADGVVLAINTATGSYVSPQGVYEPYTQAQVPVVVMGMAPTHLQVRVYIDEILVHRLPPAEHITARMFIRGTEISVPLAFARIQPYVSPKIELSDERQERVDVRVLPMIFRFKEPPGTHVYPGQLVDVYVGQK